MSQKKATYLESVIAILSGLPPVLANIIATRAAVRSDEITKARNLAIKTRDSRLEALTPMLPDVSRSEIQLFKYAPPAKDYAADAETLDRIYRTLGRLDKAIEMETIELADTCLVELRAYACILAERIDYYQRRLAK